MVIAGSLHAEQNRPVEKLTKHGDQAHGPTACQQDMPAPTPVAVVGIPTVHLEASAPQQPQCAAGKPEKSGWHGIFSDPNAAFAGAVALFTLALVGVGFWQGVQLRRTVDATKRAADAALESAKAFTDTERAYVFFLDARQVGLVDNPTYEVIWKNFGKTPAMVTSLRMWCGPVNEPPLPTRGIVKDLPKGAIIGAGDTWQRGKHKFSAEDKSAGMEGKKLFLSAEITYLDILQGKTRKTWFCRQYAGRQFVLPELTDEKLNGYT